MVRTAADKNRVTGEKAPRKRVPARPGAVVPKLPKKRQSIGTYRRNAQPIPKWQKSIAEFCIPIDIQSSSIRPTMPSTIDEQRDSSFPMLVENDEQPSSLSSATPVADDIETDSPSSALSMSLFDIKAENVDDSYDEYGVEEVYLPLYEETEDKENEVVVKEEILDDLKPCQVAMKPANQDPLKTAVIMEPQMYETLEEMEEYGKS